MTHDPREALEAERAELMACPFCGVNADLTTSRRLGNEVFCDNCTARAPKEIWNTRLAAQPLGDVREAWPAYCRSPGSCQRHRACMYTNCKHEGQNIPAAIDALVPGGGVGEATNALYWAVGRWNAEVYNRPLQNIHRRSLDTTWRQVIRHFGGDDVDLCGPRHDELIEATLAPQNAGGESSDGPTMVPVSGPVLPGDILRYEVDEETKVGKVIEHLRPSEATPAPADPQLEPWRDELSEIIGHLGAAITQSVASDDQIIMDHVKGAHEIAKIVRRKADV